MSCSTIIVKIFSERNVSELELFLNSNDILGVGNVDVPFDDTFHKALFSIGVWFANQEEGKLLKKYLVTNVGMDSRFSLSSCLLDLYKSNHLIQQLTSFVEYLVSQLDLLQLGTWLDNKDRDGIMKWCTDVCMYVVV